MGGTLQHAEKIAAEGPKAVCIFAFIGQCVWLPPAVVVVLCIAGLPHFRFLLRSPSLASVKQRQRLEAREAVEEDMMTRVPLSKEEAKKMKQHQRAGMSGKDGIEHPSSQRGR